ncbi:hypothetical protein OG884_15770 [Streptosporangium sp. NBC_01755]|uniref:hypothetical protein n=1 Tax=Streptosporangium sp. NBC_01755 TaxID=2975949 RepID=UPI002DDAB38D|nr:hypothetical protein [Streptosporangium sp. NBC_01755]WSD03292.1 hypothetical protein OG884_15770 [Streptosporangium sp. NBC_01755]
MASYPPEAWQRLGALLRARRVALNPVFRHRVKFCEATGLGERLVFDLELAKRTNFRPEVKVLLERGYQLAPGSIDRTLAAGGHALEVIEEQGELGVMDVPADPGLVMIPVSPDMPEDQREELRRWGIQMARYLEERSQGDVKPE